MNESHILLYETDEGKFNVDVILKDYMIKRFVIDVDKMKNGPKFGKELSAKLEILKKLLSESIIS